MTTLAVSMPELSLIFFLVLFVGLVAWLVSSRSTRWDRDARIPLDESSDGGTNHVR